MPELAERISIQGQSSNRNSHLRFAFFSLPLLPDNVATDFFFNFPSPPSPPFPATLIPPRCDLVPRPERPEGKGGGGGGGEREGKKKTGKVRSDKGGGRGGEGEKGKKTRSLMPEEVIGARTGNEGGGRR